MDWREREEREEKEIEICYIVGSSKGGGEGFIWGKQERGLERRGDWDGIRDGFGKALGEGLAKLKKEGNRKG